MGEKILHVADDYWNIRGSFKIAGVIDIGTQASLVKLESGKFIFLDSYTLKGRIKDEIEELTNDGRDVEAVLNLHPFHTVHVEAMHQQYPNASHFGTARHLARFPELEWQKTCTEEARLHLLFERDFEFSVPRGVDFISSNEHVHFSSVLAFHRASRTIHVDDTLMYVRLPTLAKFFGLKDSVSFHPTLAKALEPRQGAAYEFNQWAESILEKWQDVNNLCAAHTATLVGSQNDTMSINDRLVLALEKIQGTLKTHERKFG